MVSEVPCTDCELTALHYSCLEFLSGWIPRRESRRDCPSGCESAARTGSWLARSWRCLCPRRTRVGWVLDSWLRHSQWHGLESQWRLTWHQSSGLTCWCICSGKELCYLPGNHSKEYHAFDVEERDWAKGANSTPMESPLPWVSRPHQPCTILVRHIVPARLFVENRWAVPEKVGQFLYSLKEMPFNPGALQVRALRINSHIAGARMAWKGLPALLMLGYCPLMPAVLWMCFCEMIFKFFLGDIKSATLGCGEEFLFKGVWIPVEGFPGFTLLFPPFPVVFSSEEE